jgi:hypothetical protein
MELHNEFSLGWIIGIFLIDPADHWSVYLAAQEAESFCSPLFKPFVGAGSGSSSISVAQAFAVRVLPPGFKQPGPCAWQTGRHGAPALE